MKVLEITHASGLTSMQFKGSPSWLRRFMKQKCFALWQPTSVCQKLPEDCKDKLMLSYQRNMMGHIANVNETPVCFNIPASTTVSEKAANLLAMGNELS